MIRTKKHLHFGIGVFALLLSVSLLAVLGLTVQPVYADDTVVTHMHTDGTWTALTEAGGTVGEGSSADQPAYVYLSGDLILENNLTVTGTVTLCLNGYKLTGTGGGCVIKVASWASLTLCDCMENSELPEHQHAYYADSEGVYVFDNGQEGWQAAYEAAEQKGVIRGGVITGGSATDGGGLYCSEDATLTITGGTIAGNRAVQSGGGLYTYAAALTLSGGTVTGNYAQGGGGIGTMNPKSHAVMTGGTVTGNHARKSGGIRVWSGSFEFRGGTVTGNTSIEWYGNVEVGAYAQVTVTGGFFGADAFSVTTQGDDTGELIISGGSFTEDLQTYIDAGYVAAGYQPEPSRIPEYPYTLIEKEHHCDNGTFTTVLTSAGGTLTDGSYFLQGDLVLENDLTVTGTVTLCLNGYRLTGTGGGSVITVSKGASLTLCDCMGDSELPEHQHAYYADGDGVYVFDNGQEGWQAAYEAAEQKGVIRGGVITGGNSWTGGGMEVTDAELTITGGTIAGNRANTSGGGLCISDSVLNLEGGTVTGNYAQNGGGIGTLGDNQTVMSGGTVADNRAQTGGGIYAWAGSFEFSGGTVTGNTTISTSRFGGVEVGPFAQVKVTGGSFGTDAFSVTIQSDDIIGELTISGGAFEEDLQSYQEKGYIAPGFKYGTLAEGETYRYVVVPEAYHVCACGISDTALRADTATLTDGIYFLSGDLVLENNLTVTGTVTLCLNGYKLTGNGNGPVITLASGASLTLCDCMENSELPEHQHAYYADSEGVYMFDNGQEGWQAAYEEAEQKGVIRGGVITGGSASGGSASGGGGLYIGQNASFKMLGGSIAGNRASGRGAGIAIDAHGTALLSGGTIAGNVSQDSGGGIGVVSIWHNTITITLDGTVITDNTANNGGGIFSRAGGTIVITGGAITDNRAIGATDGYGGGINLQNGTLEITDGLISGNTARSLGGGIYFYGKLLVSGGEITDNRASQGYGIYIAYIATGGNWPAVISGGFIAGNGNTSATADMSGGQIYMEKPGSSQPTPAFSVTGGYFGEGGIVLGFQDDGTAVSVSGGYFVQHPGDLCNTEQTVVVCIDPDFGDPLYLEGFPYAVYALAPVTVSTNEQKPVYDGAPVTEGEDFVLSGMPEQMQVSYTFLREGEDAYTDGLPVSAGVYTLCVTGFDPENRIYYQGSGSLTVQKADYDMSGVTFDDRTVSYSGAEMHITVDGVLPEGVIVSYTPGGTKPGTYQITAYFAGDSENYNPIPPMTATLTIEKATIDMSGVTLPDMVVTYNGEEQSIVLSGTLPQGVQVSYTGGGTDAGTYTVRAIFTVDTALYNPVETLTATLEITAREIEVNWDKTLLTYTGMPQAPTASAATGIEGETVTLLVSGAQTGAGSYSAEATLDNRNYVLLGNRIGYTIGKAIYDMSGVIFPGNTVTYDGQEKTVTVVGTLPEGVQVTYLDNVLTEAGTVVATALFAGDEENYEPIAPMYATLTVGMAQPEYTVPQGLTGVVGQTLSEIALPAGWAWADGTQLLDASGSCTADAVFLPQDPDNYRTVRTQVSISVSQAQEPSGTSGDPGAQKGTLSVGAAIGISAGTTAAILLIAYAVCFLLIRKGVIDASFLAKIFFVRID